jgi:hypothetical protein
VVTRKRSPPLRCRRRNQRRRQRPFGGPRTRRRTPAALADRSCPEYERRYQRAVRRRRESKENGGKSEDSRTRKAHRIDLLPRETASGGDWTADRFTTLRLYDNFDLREKHISVVDKSSAQELTSESESDEAPFDDGGVDEGGSGSSSDQFSTDKANSSSESISCKERRKGGRRRGEGSAAATRRKEGGG